MWFEVVDEYYSRVGYDATLIGNLLLAWNLLPSSWGSQRGILTFLKLEVPYELWNISTSFGAKSSEYIV